MNRAHVAASKAQQAQSLERDNKAIAMRVRRITWEEIAETLGYASRSACQRQVNRRLVNRQKEIAASADSHVADLLAELDELAAAAWVVLESQHVTISDGRVVRDHDAWIAAGNEGIAPPIVDQAPVLQAIDRLTRIMERKAKLLGLDKPTLVEAGLRVTIEGIPESEMP
jgi:hypothetical protein